MRQFNLQSWSSPLLGRFLTRQGWSYSQQNKFCLLVLFSQGKYSPRSGMKRPRIYRRTDLLELVWWFDLSRETNDGSLRYIIFMISLFDSWFVSNYNINFWKVKLMDYFHKTNHPPINCEMELVKVCLTLYFRWLRWSKSTFPEGMLHSIDYSLE